MKFYCISNTNQKTTNDLLKNACEERGIEFVFANNNTVANKGDLVYRVVGGKQLEALEIEEKLIRSGAIGFYTNYFDFAKKYDRLGDYDSTQLSELGISTPNAISFTEFNHLQVLENIKSLNDFPIILKVLGGSHGVGVIRLDSIELLFSLGDYLTSKNEKFVLKEYIPNNKSARLIIIGSKVVDSIEYVASENDFRSNEGEHPNVRKMTYPDNVQSLAIKAVESLGLEFGGVDILLSDRGPLVVEVNYPCFFPRCQMLTGVDISGLMVDYLVDKSKKNL